MSIESTVIEQYPQRDGEIHVVERHTDNLGQQYMRFWIAEAGTDIDAATSAHAAEIEAQLAQAEIDEALDG